MLVNSLLARRLYLRDLRIYSSSRPGFPAASDHGAVDKSRTGRSAVGAKVYAICGMIDEEELKRTR